MIFLAINKLESLCIPYEPSDNQCIYNPEKQFGAQFKRLQYGIYASTYLVYIVIQDSIKLDKRGAAVDDLDLDICC